MDCPTKIQMEEKVNDRNRKKDLLRGAVLLMLLLFTWAVYGQTAHHEFILWDDRSYVSENPRVVEGLEPASVLWALSATQMGLWHPLTWLSHMADVELFGLNPGGHHLMNLLLHLLSGCLLFTTLLRMTGALWRSAFVAALFLLHPVNVESVAWVAERKNVLSALFWMLSMWAYVFYVEKPGAVRYGFLFLSLTLGLLAKPTLVTLPFVFLLLDIWPLKRWRIFSGAGTPWRLFREKAPFFVLAGIAAGATIHAAASVSTLATAVSISVSNRLANALISYVKYLGIALWPHDLAFFYPHPVTWAWGQLVFSVAVLAIITAGVLYRGRHNPYLFVGWFWFLGTLVPVIGIVQVGSQALADRYAYLPLIGVFLMATWGLPDLVRGAAYRRRTLAVGASLILVCLAWATARQVGYWQSSLTLFGHAARTIPRNYLAHDLYGLALMEKGRYSEATAHFEAAIRAKEDFSSPYNNLGLVRMKQGRPEAAVPYLETAVHYSPDSPEVRFNLAEALVQSGRTVQAVTEYQKAEAIRPGRPNVANNLGVALTRLGRDDEAAKAFQRAIALDPGYAGAHNNLAMIRIRQGQIDAAIAGFQEAVRLQPNYAHAHYQLAKALKSKGFPDAASFHARKATQINPLYGAE